MSLKKFFSYLSPAVIVGIIIILSLVLKLSDKYENLSSENFFWFFMFSLILIGLLIFIAVLLRKRAFDLSLAKKDADAAKRKAQDADLAKSKFLANISHEIRTPMNSILGFAELLNEEAKTETAKNYISHIKNSGQTLLKLIDDILDMSKIEAGMFKFIYQPANIRELLKFVENEFSFAVQKKGIEFSINVDDDIPEYFLIDELRVRQVIINIVGNAVKFTSAGYVNVDVSKKSIDDNLKKMDICIEVSDSGIGIPEKEHARMFKSFTQNDGQDSIKFGGTGLGLSLTKKLAELMNGEILLDSIFGYGSTFSFILKDVAVVDKKKRAVYERNAGNIDFLKKAEILILEPVSSRREIFREYLYGYNLKIFEVLSCAEVFNFLEKRIPDIIIFDMELYQTEEIDIIEYINKNDLVKKIMLIVLLSSDDNISEHSLRSRGVSGFIKKPFVRDDLVAEIMKFVPYVEKSVHHKIKDGEKTEYDYIKKNDLLEMYNSPNFNYEDFCEFCDVKLMNKWIEIEKSFIISDIEDFSKELSDCGERFNAVFFSNLGQDLSRYVHDFDIEKINNLIDIFPVLLKKVKKFYNEE
ncbi:MAG: hypothetical protein CSB21_02325 [Deltaproteobacteria bacterium]|nr:MAG: hypothetical protein CSB21_02325 [Deltaproteobacteria bacterium]